MKNNTTSKEVWKNIKEHEAYEVSNLGRVRSLNYKKTGETRVLSALNGKKGYKFVILNKKTCYIHRLVAEAFLPNPNNLPQINHINEQKDDNRLENLEWCDEKYNVNYGSRNKNHSETCRLKREARQMRIKDFNKKMNKTIETQIEHRKVDALMNIYELKKRITELDELKKQALRELNEEVKKFQEQNKMTKWDLHAVLQLDMEGNIIKEWKSVFQVKKELDLDVRSCVKGTTESAGGFKWCYKISRG